MNHAIVENGLVSNIIVWDGDTAIWSPPEGQSAVALSDDSPVVIGWSYSGTDFAAPPAPPAVPAPVPFSVTKRQGRLALLAAGKLSAVTDAIAALPSPQKDEAQIEWDDATSYERASPFVAMLAEKIGLDDAALDALFTQAATL